MEPPEATSIKSMLNITGILALLIGILFLVIAVFWILSAVVWAFFFAVWALIPAIFFIIFAVMDFLVFMNCKTISEMVDRRQYVQAKSKTLIWMIIGFIFGGIIPGVLMLVAYIKYDDLIRWGQPGAQYPQQQPYYQPNPQAQPQQYPPQQPPPQYPPQP
jgi:hypothetical protein